ncbi:OsmC family protein [Phytoactinopolyspora limicola]|uniref:OsmC family protein n=1 Tax=Phytoactinopolyspora limicola TaxID=2715536 RepID=UPI00140CEEEB|nr:OsmC family protein [Phytoactinopolyspora limicola]
MSLIDEQTLRHNVEDTGRRLAADPGFGVVFPAVTSALDHNVGSTVWFEQYGEEFRMTVDESAGRGGVGAGPSPMRYLLASLAGCLQVWCAKAAALRGKPIDALEIDVTSMLDMRGEHRVGTTPAHPQWFFVDVRLGGDICASAAQDVVDEALRRCPVASLLVRAVPIHTRISVGDVVVSGEVPAELRSLR